MGCVMGMGMCVDGRGRWSCWLEVRGGESERLQWEVGR